MDTITLMIADDMEMNRNVIKKLLGKDFYVVEAVNGVEALQTLEQVKVDVVILDIIMPEMDGIEVLQEVKKRPEWNHIGFLVATSKKEQTERMALNAGADDVVAKPYDPIVIKQRVKNILAKKEMDKQIAEDIKGISSAERRRVDKALLSMKRTCQMISENIENKELVLNMVENIDTDVQMLIEMLMNREGY